MTTSESDAAYIAGRAEFLKVQKEIAKLDFPKSARNPHFDSRFCPLDVVMEKVLPIVHKHNFVLIQQPTTIDGEPALRTTLLHDGGFKVEDTMLTLPKKREDQSQGSGITYARRYAVQCLFGITPEDDTDGNSPRGESKPAQQSNDISAADASTPSDFAGASSSPI